MRRTSAVLILPAVCAVIAAAAPAAAAHGNHTPAGDSSAGEPGSYSIELGIHGDSSLERDFTCPTQDADVDSDGIVNTLEGLPSYGEIHIALTTEGDTTPASGLAVDRFPVAGADGSLSYERMFTARELPDGTATAVRNLHVVTHGIDVNGNGEYDLAAGPSELDPALPQEATAPASCGIIEGSNISTIPAGGVDTGVGPLTGTGNGAVAGPPVLTFSAIVGIGALWVIGVGLRRQRTALR